MKLFRKIDAYKLELIKRALALFVFLMLCMPSSMLDPKPTQAFGAQTVFDPSVFAQTVVNTFHAAHQVQALYAQIVLMKNQIDNLTGTYGYGNIVNKFEKAGKRSWQEISDAIREGRNPALAGVEDGFFNGLPEAMNDVKTRYTLIEDTYLPVHKKLKEAYSDQYMATLEGAGFARMQKKDFFNSETKDALDSLKNQIDSTENVKAAIDLNNTMAYTMIITLQKILATQNQILDLQATTKLTENEDKKAWAQFLKK